MKRVFAATALIIAIGLLPSLALADSPLPKAVVTGRITLETRSHHGGIIVHVDGATTTTLADGRFVLGDIPAGQQVITARAPGFLSAQATLTLSPGQFVAMPALQLRAGDVNGDAAVTLLDLAIVGGQYSRCPPTNRRADINGDGCVDLVDLVIIAAAYGSVGPDQW